MKLRTIVMGTALAALLAAAAFAHGKATGIVKERMDGMSVMGKTMKALAPMMRGEVAYDAQAVRDGGKQIGSHAGEAMTKRFPQGSGGKPSEAKDAIWENWEEFAALAEQLHAYSEGLALAADNGLMMAGQATANSSAMMGSNSTMMGGNSATMSAVMGREELSEMPADGVFTMVSQTCSACHTKFRIEAK
ncbi:MAG: cytochrome c [Rhodobacteraceae bacterium]|nr:cytochrome c [Paracoccaceae bacterium]